MWSEQVVTLKLGRALGCLVSAAANLFALCWHARWYLEDINRLKGLAFFRPLELASEKPEVDDEDEDEDEKEEDR